MSRYLKKDRGRYYYQRRVPRQLRDVLGHEWWRIYLKTSDKMEAELRRDTLAKEHTTIIAAFKRMSEPDRTALSNAGGVEKLKRVASALSDSLALVTAGAELLTPYRYDEDGDEMPYEMRDELEDARDEALSEIKRVDAELITSTKLLTTLGLRHQTTRLKPDTILGWFDQWENEHRHQLDTIKKTRVAVRRFVEINGNLRLRDVTRKHVKTVRDMCLKLPNSHHLPLAQRTQPVRELIALGNAKGFPKVKPSSVQKDLDLFKAYLECAYDDETNNMAANPASGVKMPKLVISFSEQKKEKTRPLTAEHLKRVLSHIDGSRRLRRAETYRWLTLLCAYQGTRIEEVCQLVKSDIVTIGGIKCLRLHDADDQHSLKNPASVRTIPIHPKLLDDFGRYLKSIKGKRVFPDLKPSIDPDSGLSKYSSAASSALNRIIRNCGITDKRYRFHGTRGAFLEACRAAGLPEDIRHDLAGHSQKNKHAAGYLADESAAKIKILFDALAKVEPLAG